MCDHLQRLRQGLNRFAELRKLGLLYATEFAIGLPSVDRVGYNAPVLPSTSTTWQYLAPNPKSAYTQLFIIGTRIRARVLYGLFMSAEEPMTPEEIAADYRLPVEAVHEAIAYCRSDPPEIKKDFEREESLMEATGMNDPDYKYGGKYKMLSPQELARILNS